MREKKSAMDAASEELERRSRYLSSLIPRTKLKTEEEEKDKEKGKEKEKDKEELDPQDQQNVRVRAADMSPAMQRKAFRCAREVLKEMTKLDSKRLALALKKKEGTSLDFDRDVRSIVLKSRSRPSEIISRCSRLMTVDPPGFNDRWLCKRAFAMHRPSNSSGLFSQKSRDEQKSFRIFQWRKKMGI